ncbi:MAG: formyltransferase family protein, partial [Gemmatimonadaceae bacterium]|nr:formyltransferase family protein [Gemmatimonadaceae bacterium]
MLRERGHTVVAVISDAESVANWGRSVGAAGFLPDTDWAAPVAALDVDYLFSVANLRMLGPDKLAVAKQAAINFHDGPLPRYAGIGAPVWSILDGQREHGVSWHRMTNQADAGAILKQRIFPIAPDEHVVSLNARCFE